ncbi:CBU_1079 family Dot/Icm type IV secretion system effector [Bowmanella denitrificans]|uniref:CBU_1079 family Dot/Icm type IV secretion system effector n=1 Tax=Bowmanella denitrificans TaxID=366582 RepID=A0ABN0XIG6_9ALTE
MAISAEQVNEFWFGQIVNELAEPGRESIWYAGGEAVDNQIRQRFSQALEMAARDELNHWLEMPRGRLAMILLFDQFSRNIYRGQAQAFAYDDKALCLCQEGIALGQDVALSLVERLFFYHPLEHAEDLNCQQDVVNKFTALAQQYPRGQQHNIAQNALKYAVEHRDIIARFGRFPHRNEILGRNSTEQEKHYLSSGGKRFGQ